MDKSQEIKNLLDMVGSLLEWIEDILDGKKVPDFAMSFSVVRRVRDLVDRERFDPVCQLCGDPLIEEELVCDDCRG